MARKGRNIWRKKEIEIIWRMRDTQTKESVLRKKGEGTVAGGETGDMDEDHKLLTAF